MADAFLSLGRNPSLFRSDFERVTVSRVQAGIALTRLVFVSHEASKISAWFRAKIKERNCPRHLSAPLALHLAPSSEIGRLFAERTRSICVSYCMHAIARPSNYSFTCLFLHSCAAASHASLSIKPGGAYVCRWHMHDSHSTGKTHGSTACSYNPYFRYATNDRWVQ